MEEEKTQTRPYKAHVLVLPFPAQGHINPMLQFAKRLVSKGLKATLATTVFISSTARHGGEDSASAYGISIETFSDGQDIGGFAAAESTEAYLDGLKSTGSSSLASLIAKLDASGHPVDAIIYDGFLPWALSIARQLGKVAAVFFTQSCAVNNIYYHVQQGLLQLPLQPDTAVELPGLPPLLPSEMPSYLYVYGSYPAWSDLIVNQSSNVSGADFVLFNTFYELEKQVVDWVRSNLWPVKTIGPTIPSKYLDKRLEQDEDYGINLFKSDTGACLTWLDCKPAGSVVYVSFGSMADLEPSYMADLAQALKRTGHHFVWVVREPELAKLPEGFAAETAELGLILTWCPQLQVLQHKSIGCFMSHCGWNSVLEALSLGVPMVAMPQWTDQATNAKFVEDVWRVGTRVREDMDILSERSVSHEAAVGRAAMMENCIKRVMQEKDMKETAIRWSDMAKKAVSEGGSSDKNIDEFVSELCGKCS